MPETNQLAEALLEHFVQRHDVKAIQKSDLYMPVTTTGKVGAPFVPWSLDDVTAHLTGQRSYGHYLVDKDGKSRVLAFDIDISKPNPQFPREFLWVGIEPDGLYSNMEPRPLNPREAWFHPQAPETLRRFLRAQLMEAANLLSVIIVELLELPVAVSYSGNKGVHVYALTGPMSADELREMGKGVMDYTEQFEPLRGKNFYKAVSDDPYVGLGCIDVEVFPKQGKVGDGLGNLMRLPLGTHMKSGQPSYFLSLSGEVDEFKELDPMTALEGDPWAK
jgi:hypothetical protein